MGNENAVSARETLAHEEEDPTIDNEGAYHVSELKRYAPLLPLIAGLACSRVGLNASVYSNYAQTDAGFISDGTVLAALIVFAPLLFAITKLNEPLSKAFVNRSATAVFALETICVALLEYGTLFPLQEAVRFVIAAICTITSTCAMYYWLRRARGGSVIIGATLVFSAIAASELILMLVNCLPAGPQAIIATVISAAQFPAQHIAKRTSNPFQLVKNNEPRSAYSLKCEHSQQAASCVFRPWRGSVRANGRPFKRLSQRAAYSVRPRFAYCIHAGHSGDLHDNRADLPFRENWIHDNRHMDHASVPCLPCNHLVRRIPRFP